MMFMQEVHFVSWREIFSDITTFFHSMKYFHGVCDLFHGVKFSRWPLIFHGVKGKFHSHSNNF